MSPIIKLLLPILKSYGIKLAYAALVAVLRDRQGKVPKDAPQDVKDVLAPIVEEHGEKETHVAMLKAIQAHRREVAAPPASMAPPLLSP